MNRYLLIICILLSSCVDLLTYREGYIIANMYSWVDSSGNEATLEERNDCYKFTEKVIALNNKEWMETYGKCLYNKGFRFRTTSWLYCYHKKEKCEIYNKYRK